MRALCRATFLFLCISFSLHAHIILVHIGPTIPPYIFTGLEQARLFNPETDICLIANQTAIAESGYDFSKGNFTAVPCESLTPTSQHITFNQKTPHPPHVSNGFWRKAIERFFFLHEYMMAYDLKDVVHLESDIMLYVDLATLTDLFNHYKGIAAVFDADARCIPSFVYIPHKEAITDLINYISNHAREPLSDMQFIAHYRNASPREKIDQLPLIMPAYIQAYGLQNARGHKPADPNRYCQYADVCNAIFDGAAIGQFLGGIDPIHGSLKIGFVNETCVFNVSLLNYVWEKDEQGRKVPYALFQGKKYRINNLHIHSKQLDKFRS